VLALIAVIFVKVNAAGGAGDSITLLCGESASARRSLLHMIAQSNQLFQPIPIYLSRFGLRAWEG
jgi:D-glycero-alpha-D-manno-heptose-7-phosphate kinase